MGNYPFNGTPPLQLQASTGINGFELEDATPNIISWTTPNDGQLHRVTFFVEMDVSLALTGGAIYGLIYIPNGVVNQKTIIPANSIAGVVNPSGDGFPFQRLVAPNTLVAVQQGTAITAGAAQLWAEIWGS